MIEVGLQTKPGETVWLLSAAPSRTYVAYQPHPHIDIPLTLDTPIARIDSERFTFGKLVVSRSADGALQVTVDAAFHPFWCSENWRAQAWQNLGTHPSDILVHTDAPKVKAAINGDEIPVVREMRAGQTAWVLDPYARLPRVRDRVGSNRPSDSSRDPEAATSGIYSVRDDR